VGSNWPCKTRAGSAKLLPKPVSPTDDSPNAIETTKTITKNLLPPPELSPATHQEERADADLRAKG